MKFLIKESDWLENYFELLIGTVCTGEYVILDGDKMVKLNTSPYPLTLLPEEVEEI